MSPHLYSRYTFCWSIIYQNDFVSFELSKLFESDFVGADIVPNVASQRNVGEFVVYTQ